MGNKKNGLSEKRLKFIIEIVGILIVVSMFGLFAGIQSCKNKQQEKINEPSGQINEDGQLVITNGEEKIVLPTPINNSNINQNIEKLDFSKDVNDIMTSIVYDVKSGSAGCSLRAERVALNIIDFCYNNGEFVEDSENDETYYKELEKGINEYLNNLNDENITKEDIKESWESINGMYESFKVDKKLMENAIEDTMDGEPKLWYDEEIPNLRTFEIISNCISNM